MSNPGSIPTPIHRSKRSSRSSRTDRKSTRLNSSHGYISYAVFCLKKKKNHRNCIVVSLHIIRSESVALYHTLHNLILSLLSADTEQRTHNLLVPPHSVGADTRRRH